MWMDREREVLCGRAHLNGQNTFRDQFAGAVPNNSHAENSLRFRLDDQLGQTFRSVK